MNNYPAWWRAEELATVGGLDDNNVNVAVGTVPLVEIRELTPAEIAGVDRVRFEAEIQAARAALTVRSVPTPVWHSFEDSVSEKYAPVSAPTPVLASKPRGFFAKLRFLFSE